MGALALLLVSLAESAGAGAGSFTLVNGTSTPLSGLEIHRFQSSATQVGVAALAPGGQAPVRFSDPDCAFDISATAGGSRITWKAVNLCEVSVVTLKRNASGETWAEYD